MFNEKRYSRHGFEYVECPRCYGRGSESASVFIKDTCTKCDGTGAIMIESSREMEVASHRHQDESNDRKNAWLFS